MNCDYVAERIEEYVLGILDGPEAADVARHIGQCDACAALAGKLEGLAHELPLALAAKSPERLPPSVKLRLFERVAAANAAPASSPEPASHSTVTPISTRMPRRLRLPALSFAAAAILLAVAVGWSLQLSAALAQERALRSEYASLVDQQETVLEVVDSPRTVKRQLRATMPGSSAYGKLYTRPDLSTVVVMAARLAEPDTGKEYRLWLTLNGQERLAGTVPVNNQGFGLLIFEAGIAGPLYESARLTLDPVGIVAPTDSILRWSDAP